MVYVGLLVGFWFLIKGADYLVEGSSKIAKRFKVPRTVIGLTIVALGTSCPEAFVSVVASLEQQNAIAFGNMVGSNIFNLLVIVGVAALLSNLGVEKKTVKRELPMSIVATIIVLGMIVEDRVIGRLDGVILLLGFVAFVGYSVLIALNDEKQQEFVEEAKEVSSSIGWNLFVVISGILLLVFGSCWVVEHAVTLTEVLGISETLVGITVVAIGTSLPELITSIVAVMHQEGDLALGNVIGSNLFNCFMVLGAAAIVSPIPVGESAIYDCVILIVYSLIGLVIAWTGKKINRVEGSVLIGLYVIYVAYIIMR